MLAGAHRDVTDLHAAHSALDTHEGLVAILSGNVPAVLHRIRVTRDAELSARFVGPSVRGLLAIEPESCTMQQQFAMMTPATRQAAEAPRCGMAITTLPCEREQRARLPPFATWCRERLDAAH